MSTAASKSENAAGERRPRLLGALRGGEENTAIGRHREAQQEDTLAKVPAVLQNALIEDLSKSVASAANGDGTHPSPGSWVITGEFLEVDTGNRALQAGVGFGAGESHLEVRAKIYAVPNMDTPFLTFDSDGASGHMPGAAVMQKSLRGRSQVRDEQEGARERGKESCSVNCGRDRQIYGRAINPDT